MQIPTTKVFSLNPASTPQITWGTLDPATEFTDDDLALLPPASTYYRMIGDPITSATGWFKAMTDEAADLLAISPWVLISFPAITTGTATPDFASDEFVAYVPGQSYVQTATLPTGAYRTVWTKVSAGGERSNWISLPESTAIEYIVASITRTANIATTPTTDWATPVWNDYATGTPTVTINSTGSIGLVGTAMALTIKTAGIYRITAQVWLTAAGSDTKAQLALKKNSTYYVLAQAPTPSDATAVLNGTITLPLAVADVLVVAGAHDGDAGNLTRATLELQGIGPTP